jgi:hypothetical protein
MKEQTMTELNGRDLIRLESHVSERGYNIKTNVDAKGIWKVTLVGRNAATRDRAFAGQASEVKGIMASQRTAYGRALLAAYERLVAFDERTA